jgi:pimeloyl-ACP methyl ester carboxylesterase
LRGALLIFPGVVRVIGHGEFGPQLEALQSGLPCLETYRVPTKSFIAPRENAKDGCRTLRRATAELGADVPIHMLGYSQGARNALQTLLTCPHDAERIRSLVTLNSAARGSELADILSVLLPMPRLQRERCERFGCFRGWWCRRNPGPRLFARAILPAAALATGAPIHDVDEFLESEGLEGGSLGDFLLKRVDGVRSLSTYEAVNFWSEAAEALPEDVLYLSFRSIVSDPERNLPASNALFYEAIRRAGGRRPQNDMQVRLVNQRLGGPLSRVEVVGPVAEGNHWQWEMNPDDLPEYVMPDAMFEGIPRSELLLAYYQTLNEAGILLAPMKSADAE